MTRTAQLYAYREATRASYMANKSIVRSWTWHAELNDDRTCMACIAMHGSVHPVDESLNDHHRGRCVPIPNTPTWAELGITGVEETNVTVQPGEQWFRGLSAAEQEARMGAARYQAWLQGEFQFQQLVTTYQDDVYGEMRREASLKEILQGPGLFAQP